MSWPSYQSMSKFYLIVYGILGVYKFPGKEFSYIWSRVLRVYVLGSLSTFLLIYIIIIYSMINDKVHIQINNFFLIIIRIFFWIFYELQRPRNPQALIEGITTFGVMLQYIVLCFVGEGRK